MTALGIPLALSTYEALGAIAGLYLSYAMGFLTCAVLASSKRGGS